MEKDKIRPEIKPKPRNNTPKAVLTQKYHITASTPQSVKPGTKDDQRTNSLPDEDASGNSECQGESQEKRECSKTRQSNAQQQTREENENPSHSESSSQATSPNKEINSPHSKPMPPLPGSNSKSTLPLTTDSAADYGGSDGYIRVYMGDKNGDLCCSDNSSSDENVEVNATVAPGVQHLHIHINLSFAQESKRGKQRRTKTMQFKRSEGHIKSYSEKKYRSSAPTDATEFSEDPPPIPPKPFMKSRKGADGYLTAVKAKHNSDDDSEYESYDTKGYISRRRHRDYDEIDEQTLLIMRSNESSNAHFTLGFDNDEIYAVPSTNEKHGTELGNDQRIADLGHPWLFHHTQIRKAEGKVETDQFVAVLSEWLIRSTQHLIEEDIACMPFSPYTVMVVHEERLKKIPVIKHRLKQGNVKYTLVSCTEHKFKSIQDLVCYYQRHEIPELRLRLRLPG